MNEPLLEIPINSNIFVLSGAGISKESGIQTFRDSDGLWNNHRIEDVASPEGFYRNPTLVYDFYNNRRKELNSGTEANKGHFDLVELEKSFKINIITQNIDDLHEKAGSSSIIHMHGELNKARSASLLFSYKSFAMYTFFPGNKSITLSKEEKRKPIPNK